MIQMYNTIHITYNIIDIILKIVYITYYILYYCGVDRIRKRT